MFRYTPYRGSVVLSIEVERIFFENQSKYVSQVICRNRRVFLVEIFVRSANYSFFGIFAMTCDVHRNKKCSIFHLFFKI